MTRLVKSRFSAKLAVPALLALALSGHAAFAASVEVRNESAASLQIGFDGMSPMTVASRDTARFTLQAGEHTAQCRFAGDYDGCNMEERFTLTERAMRLNLQPVLTLQHAVTLAQQAMLAVQTRREGVWATSTLDVAGAADDCANYETGKLGSVSRRVAGRATLSNVALATMTLCGDARPAVGATVNGAQLYFPPRFVTFRDRDGRFILVRQ